MSEIKEIVGIKCEHIRETTHVRCFDDDGGGGRTEMEGLEEEQKGILRVVETDKRGKDSDDKGRKFMLRFYHVDPLTISSTR